MLRSPAIRSTVGALLVVALLWPLLQSADRLARAPALRKASALVVLVAGGGWIVVRL